jgi:hypothetical protein
MSVLKPVRVALSTLLGTATGLHAVPGVPSEVVAGMVYVRPARDKPYVSKREDVANFVNPAVNMQAVLVFPSNDVVQVQDLMDQYVEDIFAALELDPTLGGLTSSVVLAEVSQPGFVVGQILAVELTFDPFLVRGLPQEA